MDYFLTTYRKDFKWPTLKMASKQKANEYDKDMKGLALHDTEPCLENSSKEPTIRDDSTIQKQSSSQQPGSKYLEKLFKKYPYLSNVMKFTNPDEMAKKILSEKYKTTYQIEYNKGEMHPANNFAEVMDVVDTVEKLHAEEKPTAHACTAGGVTPFKCECAQGISYVPCRCAKDAPVRKIAWKPAPISKIPQAPREKKKKKEDDDRAKKAAAEGQKKIKPFSTEYHDTIGKVGGIIIKKRLLYGDHIESEGKENKDKDIKNDNH